MFSERTLGKISAHVAGPCLIVTAGIHGNEPAGVRAAAAVMRALEGGGAPIRGDVFAFAGNLRALRETRRHLGRDLNRQWSPACIAELDAGRTPQDSEGLEQRELRAALEDALSAARGPCFFIDLHTTSAAGIPFALSGASARDRRFAAQLPLPVILGLQEQVPGVIAEYMGLRGCATLSVEGGQHDSPATQTHLEAVMWTALWAAGIARREDLPELPGALARLEQARGDLPSMIEVLSRHAITEADQFKMEPGFANIQRTQAGVLLARDRRGEIRAPSDGLVLLPLYQALGDDGFFYGREIS